MTMELYEDQFADDHDYSVQTATEKTLIIASTVRSGSHMLGHALHQTDAFGFPLEYANTNNLHHWKKKFGLTDTHAVMRELMRRRTSPNGVFGIKLHYSHLQTLGGFASVRALFPNPHFVFLSREDVMSQAVSLAVARQTGAWISKQQAQQQPVYRFDDIDDGLRRILFENSSWKYTLSASGAAYMDLRFEDVKSDTAHAITRIAQLMKVTVESERIPSAPVTKKQSDTTNQQWTRRFISEFNQNDELMRFNRESPLRRVKKRLLRRRTAK